MKTIKSIIAVACLLFLCFSAFSQRSYDPGKEKKSEKKEITTMKEFTSYVEAMKKGAVTPLSKSELEKIYNRIIDEKTKCNN